MTVEGLDKLIELGRAGSLSEEDIRTIVENYILEHQERGKKVQQQLMDILNDLL